MLGLTEQWEMALDTRLARARLRRCVCSTIVAYGRVGVDEGPRRQGSFRREQSRFRHWGAVRGKTRVRARARTVTMGA